MFTAVLFVRILNSGNFSPGKRRYKFCYLHTFLRFNVVINLQNIRLSKKTKTKGNLQNDTNDKSIIYIESETMHT